MRQMKRVVKWQSLISDRSSISRLLLVPLTQLITKFAYLIQLLLADILKFGSTAVSFLHFSSSYKAALGWPASVVWIKGWGDSQPSVNRLQWCWCHRCSHLPAGPVMLTSLLSVRGLFSTANPSLWANPPHSHCSAYTMLLVYCSSPLPFHHPILHICHQQLGCI